MKFTHYQGEAHPDTRKVVLTFHVKDLFNEDVLSTPLSKHKFLLLAGPRWQPPNASFVERWNTALSKGENFLSDICQKENDLGFVKITSNSMPHESQNMKWCSDVLDRMVSEANVRVNLFCIRVFLQLQAKPTYSDVPLDVRPYIASNARGGRTPRPSKSDFPKEWLP